MIFVRAEYTDAASIIIRAFGDDDNEYIVGGINSEVSPWPEYLANGGTIDPYVQAPQDSPLSPNQFYTMLENEGKLDAFIDAIETVTPTSKKLTCRNQFNNSQSFTWDMVLTQTVMPKAAIYGTGWEAALTPIWINAYNTIDAGMAP